MIPESTKQLPDTADLVVIGGGPAGSTVAGLVALQGHRVLLLEKDRHPRFHIGESLLPYNMKIFRSLGLEDKLRQIGVHKSGADFTDDSPIGNFQEFRFADALEVEAGCDHAYQVLRSDFDHLLFAYAGQCGAQTVTAARVREVDFDGEPDPVLAVEHQGGRHKVRARFVVDASGRDALLARRFGLQRRNREHATAAMFGHFQNVPRRDGESSGNISIYWFDQGWIWMIPLPGGVMSIGAVCNPGYLGQRQGDVDGFFDATIRRNRHAWARMAGGERISAITATGNYSYDSSRLDGPKWLMVGDAGIFVDPVFSSGVFFGMSSAQSGADVVLAELAGDQKAATRARRRFRYRVRRGVRELSWFIYRFPAPVLRQMFLHPRNVFRLKQAVISVLAGDVYGNPRVTWRLQLFRLLYGFLSLRDLPAALKARRQRKRNARVVFDRAA